MDDANGTGPGDLRFLEGEDGVEIVANDKEERIEHPFNPERIRIRTSNYAVEKIVSRIEREEIDLTPDLQRTRDIWKADSKSRLIESLLLRIPVPVFYVAADRNENWTAVDGIQRLSTIYDYMTGKFALSGMEYLNRLDGKKFDELARPFQRRIGETQLVVNIIEPGVPEEVTFNIFRRIHTEDAPLSGQEIRHALNPGPVRGFLNDLAKSEEFRNATNGSIKIDRMADRDCILRFLAFHIDPWEEYSDNDIDGYMGKAMKKINRMERRDREIVAADFKRAMRAAGNIFGKRAFRKIYEPDDRQMPVNRALFSAWGVGLARRSPREIDILVRNRDAVRQRFMSLLESDREFDDAISRSTGAPKRVHKPFQAIDDLISEYAGLC